MALPAAFSFRRLRRLAKSEGSISFKAYVRALPSQVPMFWSLHVTTSYTDVAYDHYVVWCKRNGKTPEGRPATDRIIDGGLGW